MQSCEWLHADHVVHDSCCIRVVCAIVEFVDGACWVLKALIPSDKQKMHSLVLHVSAHYLLLSALCHCQVVMLRLKPNSCCTIQVLVADI